MVLYKMQWELSAITPMDYLDQTIPRLGLEKTTDLSQLRKIVETILVETAKEYQFVYFNPSLMAASAIMLALQSLSIKPSEIKSKLQAATHASTVSLIIFLLENFL